MLEGNTLLVNVYNEIVMMKASGTYYESCECRREVKTAVLYKQKL